MKISMNQIRKSLNNTFVFGVDGSEKVYNTVRQLEEKAVDCICDETRKTRDYLSKSDWKNIYSLIRKMAFNY